MPIKRIRQRMEYLRQQPEPVRFRAAIVLTAGTGSVIALLWLVLLLPLQLRLTKPAEEGATTQASLKETFQQAKAEAPQFALPTPPVTQPTTAARVGGARSYATPSPRIVIPTPLPSPLPTPSPTFTPTPTPTPTLSSTVAPVAEAIPATSPSPGQQPVQYTSPLAQPGNNATLTSPVPTPSPTPGQLPTSQ